MCIDWIKKFIAAIWSFPEHFLNCPGWSNRPSFTSDLKMNRFTIFYFIFWISLAKWEIIPHQIYKIDSFEIQWITCYQMIYNTTVIAENWNIVVLRPIGSFFLIWSHCNGPKKAAGIVKFRPRNDNLIMDLPGNISPLKPIWSKYWIFPFIT